MFGLGLATKVYVAVEAVDMRKGQTLWSHMPDAVGSYECTVFVCRNSCRRPVLIQASR